MQIKSRNPPFINLGQKLVKISLLSDNNVFSVLQFHHRNVVYLMGKIIMIPFNI